MSNVLNNILSRAGKRPINYVVGIDYPVGAPNPEKRKLFYESPQGLDMASTAQSVLDIQRGEPLIGVAGNIPPHILKEIPKTGRTMWVFFNRVMPHSRYTANFNAPETLLREKPTKADEPLKKQILQTEGFKNGLYWIEGGIKMLQPYEAGS